MLIDEEYKEAIAHTVNSPSSNNIQSGHSLPPSDNQVDYCLHVSPLKPPNSHHAFITLECSFCSFCSFCSSTAATSPIIPPWFS
jgi:hypothetical protein